MPRRITLHLERGFLRHWLRLLRVRDTSEQVSRGFALGLIVNFYPTFGFGFLISGFMARLLGGNIIAGLVGGASLTFVWPVLFYLNILVGGWFIPPPVEVPEFAEVSEKTLSKLLWGKTFLLGAILNSLAAGLLSYLLMLLLYGKLRPALLEWSREFLKNHQFHFRRRKRNGAKTAERR
ncbi:MAG TPA: hypothetical protein DCY13_20525 [Verrucomicrobiales bacterium]|nr:hypothetical protein [Verrucomicrobiales bacterium]